MATVSTVRYDLDMGHYGHGDVPGDHDAVNSDPGTPETPKDPIEPLLTPNPSRFSLLPYNPEYQIFMDMYNQLQDTDWRLVHIRPSLAVDRTNWSKLDEKSRRLLTNVLAFFLVADGIVTENLAARFYDDIQVPECRLFLGMQIRNEGVHQETYAALFDNLVDRETQSKVLSDLYATRYVSLKADWMLKWLGSERPFAERLVAAACSEIMMFCANFCVIYYFKQKNNDMPALTDSNDYISRDEMLHGRFTCEVYKRLQTKLPLATVRDIVESAVDCEIATIYENLPGALVGLNPDDMVQYVKSVADVLMRMLGYDPIYHESNPFEWMDLLNADKIALFFERTVVEYKQTNDVSMDDSAFSGF